MLFAGWEVGIKDPKRLTITANSFAKMDQQDDSARRERAGRMGKFRPLPEPMRLQDLSNSARSQTEKKKMALLHCRLLL